jgi:hypothetical protein
VVNDHSDDEDVLLLIADKSCVVIRVVLVIVCCELIVRTCIQRLFYVYRYIYIVVLKCLEIRRILKQMFQTPPKRMKKKKMRNW